MGAGPAHVKDQASAPTVGWLTGTVPDTSYLRFFFFAELRSRLSAECSVAECGLPSANRGPFEGFMRTSAQ